MVCFRLPASRALLLVALVVAACAAPSTSTETADAPRITFTPSGCVSVGLDAIGAASVDAIAVENQSETLVYFEPGRLLDGTGFDAFATHASEEQARHASGEALAGPPAFIERLEGLDVQPGSTGELPVPTTPGTYGVACVVFDDPDGPPTNAFVVGPVEIPG